MEFDSQLQVFAVSVGYMITDSPYICHIAVLDCVPQLCQGSCQVFWPLTINPLYRVFSKGIIVAVCLLSVGMNLDWLFQNSSKISFWKHLHLYFVSSLSPPLPAACVLWVFWVCGFFNFCLSSGEYSECPLWKEAIGCWSGTGCRASIKKGCPVTEREGCVACYPATDQ